MSDIAALRLEEPRKRQKMSAIVTVVLFGQSALDSAAPYLAVLLSRRTA